MVKYVKLCGNYLYCDVLEMCGIYLRQKYVKLRRIKNPADFAQKRSACTPVHFLMFATFSTYLVHPTSLIFTIQVKGRLIVVMCTYCYLFLLIVSSCCFLSLLHLLHLL